MKPTSCPISRLWGLWPTGDFGPYTLYTSHKRKTVVAFVKAPPLEPPSWKQRLQTTRFQNAHTLWRALTQPARDAWTLACKRARLTISGYNFFIHVHTTQDFPAARTIENQSGISLGL